MMLAEIVVDQLVFVLAAPDDVLDPDSAVVVLQDVMTRLAELPAEELAPVRQVAEGRLAEGSTRRRSRARCGSWSCSWTRSRRPEATGRQVRPAACRRSSLGASTTRLNRSQAAWRETPRALPISA